MSRIKGMVMGIMTIVVGVILFPIILTGVSGVVNADNVTLFTGLADIAKIVPLLALLELVFAGGWVTFQSARGQSGGTNFKDVVWGEVILFLFLILFPILLSTFATLYDTAGTTYTGFRSVLVIVPMILLVGAMFGGGYLTFKGVKGTGGGKKSRVKRTR